jgi:hypothetical protein
MRLVRRTVLTAVAVVLCVSPVAVANDRHENGGGAVIAPARGGGLSGGELLGEVWAQNLALPASNDPFSGTCIPFARNVIAPHFDETGTATCTATPRTRLFLFWGSFFTELDPPSFPTTEEAQLAEAVAADQAIHELNVTVDNGRTINLVRRRFELFSPQRTVQLDDDNFYGVPARTVTFTAHAWGAVIRNLRPGQHTVTLEVVAPEFGDPFTVTTVLNVVRGGHSHEGDHGDHDHGHGHD